MRIGKFQTTYPRCATAAGALDPRGLYPPSSQLCSWLVFSHPATPARTVSAACSSQTSKPLKRLPRAFVQAADHQGPASAFSSNAGKSQAWQLRAGGRLVYWPAAVTVPGGRPGVQPHELRAVPAARVPDQHELQPVAGRAQSVGRHPQPLARPGQAGAGLHDVTSGGLVF